MKRGIGALAGQRGAMALVFAGGTAGTLARFGVGGVVGVGANGFDWPTFTVNVVGAFALGLLLESLLLVGPDSPGRRRLRLLAGTGFLGAFTTYSTFALQIDLLLRDGRAAVAATYAAASLAAGLSAVVAGIALARLARRTRPGGVR